MTRLTPGDCARFAIELVSTAHHIDDDAVANLVADWLAEPGRHANDISTVLGVQIGLLLRAYSELVTAVNHPDVSVESIIQHVAAQVAAQE